MSAQARKRFSPHVRRLRSEPLEARQMLAVTVDTLVDEADGSIDDGDISLRDAIALAPSGETIDFAVAGTILLELGELSIDKDLTIDGPGAELLTIDASGNDPTPDSTLNDSDEANDGDGSRVFDIDDGNASHNVDVAVSGLTLTGGDIPDDGGAIRSLENLVLTHTSVVNNMAGRDGGGIYIKPMISAINTISDSAISGNMAARQGGGAYVNASIFGSLTIDSTIISENRVVASYANGGGLFIISPAAAFVVVANSSISDNLALIGSGQGGGIEARVAAGAGFTVRESTIRGNEARSIGGGMKIMNDGTATIERVAVLGNSSQGSGGGIHVTTYSNGVTNVLSSTIASNDANRTGGGAQFVPYQTSEVNVGNTVIADNHAGYDGGGIAVLFQLDGGMMSFHDVSVTNNMADHDGGGIYAGGNSDGFKLSHVTISGNQAAGRYGGARLPSTLTLNTYTFVEHSTIADNVAGSYGGLDVRNARLDNTIVANNRTFGGARSDFHGTARESGTYNIVGVDTEFLEGFRNMTDGVGGNQIGTAASPIDALLGPLAYNGGPTLPGGYVPLTHALLPDSPAIDAGDLDFVSPPLLDQRGYYRVVDGGGDGMRRVDIGAYEYDSIPPLPGDGNLDGTVDGLDYLVWANLFGDNPAGDPPGSPQNGDFNDDGVVDSSDYLVWALHYRESVADIVTSRPLTLDVDNEKNDDSADSPAPVVSTIVPARASHGGPEATAVDSVFERLAKKRRRR